MIYLNGHKTSGPAQIYTGHTFEGKFNNFYSLKNKTNLEDYFHNSCSKLKGSEGTFFSLGLPQKRQPQTIRYLFNPHISCRPFKLKFRGQSSHGFIKTRQYFMDEFQYSQLYNTDNWCYCPPEKIEEECDDLFYLHQCSPGSPLVMTNVHFFRSNHLFAKVRGLRHQNPTEHLGYVEVEPTFGSTIDYRIRVQYNIDFRQSFNPNISMIMPYYWIEEVLSDYLA